jgi:S-adenosylmethionine/arginine decarboxylase-like enzyme
MKPSVGEQTFGMEVILDLAECDPKTIRSRESLVTFAKELCRVIDMKACGANRWWC